MGFVGCPLSGSFLVGFVRCFLGSLLWVLQDFSSGPQTAV